MRLSMLALILALPLAGGCAVVRDQTQATAGPVEPAPAFASQRIAVETVGEGPDVVLIPGLGSSPVVWRDMIAAIPGYRYHLVQVRGFAGVPAADNAGGPVVAPVAEEIARYIAEARLERPALIGHSMGGTLGMLVATRHPDRVGRLMVVDMFPALPRLVAGPNATPDQARPIAEEMRRAMTTSSGDDRAREHRMTISAMVGDPGKRELALADSLASDPDVQGQALYDLFTLDLTADLARFAGPVHVLWIVPAGVPATQEQMAASYAAGYAAAPDAVVAHVPDSRHFIMWDAPERFHRDVRRFLGARPAGEN